MFQFFRDLADAITGVNNLIDKINAGEINVNINLTVNGEQVAMTPEAPTPV